MSFYRLAKGVSLDTASGTLSVKHPQRVLKLNTTAVEAIRKSCGWSEENVVTEKYQNFANQLENQGILNRGFPFLNDSSLPIVSVVVPTYNRPDRLTSCLESLSRLDYPVDRLEIIVVDDASLVPVVQGSKFAGVKVIRLEKNVGQGAARNEAVSQAKGEIIAFLDDDCLAQSDWLTKLVSCFQYPDVVAVGGRVESAVLSKPLERYEQVQSPLSMGSEQRKVRRGSAVSYLATCNLLVRKSSLLAVGGFDPALRIGEDVDLCWRLSEAGGNIYYLPSGLVYHHHRSRLVPFLKRRYNYGQSEAKLQAMYPVERRRLSFFPGNSLIFGLTLLCIVYNGLLFGLTAGLCLVGINLLWQSVQSFSKLHRCGLNFRQILRAMFRSQAVALYLYSQHVSRYYSLFASALAMAMFPPALVVIGLVQLLPGMVDYKLKKPELGFVMFLICHSLDDIAYQAGVCSGCLTELSVRPLMMDFVRADRVWL